MQIFLNVEPASFWNLEILDVDLNHNFSHRLQHQCLLASSYSSSFLSLSLHHHGHGSKLVITILPVKSLLQTSNPHSSLTSYNIFINASELHKFSAFTQTQGHMVFKA
ncbi:hypothetical protein S83_067163 [Arachis hypogaea]